MVKRSSRASARSRSWWFRSLGTKLAAGMVAVVVCAAGAVFFEQSSRERSRLTASKVEAAQMVILQLSGSIASAVDFADVDTISRELANLQSNEEIVAAAVWSAFDLSEPLARIGGRLSAPKGLGPRTEVWSDRIEVWRPILDRKHARIGVVGVAFSLAREERALMEIQHRLMWLFGGMAMFLASTLIVLARYQIIKPLQMLAQAALRLERGEAARIERVSEDEIGDLARGFNKMGEAVVHRQRRLEDEMALATRIQTSILPRTIEVPMLEVAASMQPAEKVGGDYYDVLPVDDGCWVAIGDVSGHGLDSGLFMLMIQSGISALVRHDPGATPSTLVRALNRMLTENIRRRLQRQDHATLTLIHVSSGGRVRFAGAHEEMLLYRTRTGQVELIETPGTWVGVRADIDRFFVDHEFNLEPGDVLVLLTDGLFEGRNAAGKELGMEALRAVLASSGAQPVEEVRRRLVELASAWAAQQEDDMTVLVARYRPHAASSS